MTDSYPEPATQSVHGWLRGLCVLFAIKNLALYKYYLFKKCFRIFQITVMRLVRRDLDPSVTFGIRKGYTSSHNR
jgi:hypothetical protein